LISPRKRRSQVRLRVGLDVGRPQNAIRIGVTFVCSPRPSRARDRVECASSGRRALHQRAACRPRPPTQSPPGLKFTRREVGHRDRDPLAPLPAPSMRRSTSLAWPGPVVLVPALPRHGGKRKRSRKKTFFSIFAEQSPALRSPCPSKFSRRTRGDPRPTRQARGPSARSSSAQDPHFLPPREFPIMWSPRKSLRVPSFSGHLFGHESRKPHPKLRGPASL